MNCPEAQQFLQQRLDGAIGEEDPAVVMHLADCPSCREFHGAVPLLEKALRALPDPLPPDDLADRIVEGILTRRRLRVRRRRLLMVSAMAAAMLVAGLLGYSQLQPPAPLPAPNIVKVEEKPDLPKEPPAASVNQNVEEAGSALVSLTRRTADETAGQTRLLLPDQVPPMPSPGTELWQQGFEPPTRSLADAGQNVSEGLEPVTTSARRAVDLFMREMPPMGPPQPQ